MREQRGGRALKKYIYSSSVRWHLWLPLIQLGLNTRFLARTQSTPFAVMFEREFNNFDHFRNIASAMEITEAMEKRMEFWKEFKEAFLPALGTATRQYKVRN